MQMGGNPKGWLSNYSQDDQSSRLENQRLYNEALQNPIRSQDVMKPTPEGYNPTQKDLDEHWDAFARSKGYSDYASYQMNQMLLLLLMRLNLIFAVHMNTLTKCSVLVNLNPCQQGTNY